MSGIENNFTALFTGLKEVHGRTVREIASAFDLSPAYISDISKGFRKPTAAIVEKMIGYYGLNEEQQQVLYDAYADAHDTLPRDVMDYLKQNPAEVALIRSKIAAQKVKK